MATKLQIWIVVIVMPVLAASFLWFVAGKTILSVPAPAPVTPESAAIDPELVKAAANMVAPPLGTSLALMADPRRLRATMDRGIVAYDSAKNEHTQIEGARLIQVAAALGYGPARDLVLENVTEGRVMRSVVPTPDAIRYAMDAFIDDIRKPKKPNRSFLPLARFHAQRAELGAFATHVVETIRDDQRLQKSQAIERLFEVLPVVPGACQSMARAMLLSIADDYAQCPAALRQRLLTHVRKAGPVGRDENSRRHALWLMEKFDPSADPDRVGSIRPEARVIPGVFIPRSGAAQSQEAR